MGNQPIDTYFIGSLQELQTGVVEKTSQDIRDQTSQRNGILRHQIEVETDISRIIADIIGKEEKSDKVTIKNKKAKEILDFALNHYYLGAELKVACGIDVKKLPEHVATLLEHFPGLSVRIKYGDTLYNARSPQVWKGLRSGHKLMVYVGAPEGFEKDLPSRIIGHIARTITSPPNPAESAAPYTRNYMSKGVRIYGPQPLQVEQANALAKTTKLYPGKVYVNAPGYLVEARTGMRIMGAGVVRPGDKIEFLFEPIKRERIDAQRSARRVCHEMSEVMRQTYGPQQGELSEYTRMLRNLKIG